MKNLKNKIIKTTFDGDVCEVRFKMWDGRKNDRLFKMKLPEKSLKFAP